MKRVNKFFTPVALLVFLILQSCADQKKAVQDRADRMNGNTQEARNNPENMPEEPVPMQQTTGDETEDDQDPFNPEGRNELREVADRAPVGNKKLVGGVAMDPEATLYDNVSRADNLSTLLEAINTAGLTGTLSGGGPFTLLAPVNSAFEKFSADEKKRLFNPQHKTELQRFLKNHIIAGNKTGSDIILAINRGDGKASLRTLGGQSLMARLDGEQIMIEDSQGNSAKVVIPDVEQSNGSMHVIDAVITPGS